jgi:WD40 repeat protein
MNPEQWARVQALFDRAADLPAEERRAFLDDACQGDASLRAEVEDLLAYDAASEAAGDAGGILKSPLVRTSRVPPAGAALPAAPAPPPSIGHYRILRTLGEGGMGTVYEAEQESPRRPVALKVIRPGLLAPPLLKRFGQEVQILGRLHHPGIAAIHDAGVAEDGRPFFAMELIRGLPLTDYARLRGLSAPERLDLLARVCDAVQYAHDRGVIHRDLKPGNILVDEAGQPKVLDFGVARATDADLQTTTAHTEAGQLLGTLTYMSPEQIAADPAALDRRSDVYTLGVILFELLAGWLPYHLEHLPLPEVARVILEQEPSRLGSINKQFRGDVELIVAKALEKDRGRRYASAGELASDLRRYLGHEPIRARPPSALYQLRKFARRHKALTASLALAALGLVLTAAGSVALAAYFKEQEAAQRALAEDKAALADHNKLLADESKAAREKAEITLADMQASRGLLAGERGDAALAMLWFAQAARQAASDPQRQADNRLRARNWMRHALLPVRALPLGGFPWKLEFRPGGDLLLMVTPKAFFVWDWRRDRLLPWADGKVQVGAGGWSRSAACWSPDGTCLALGLPSGEVQIRRVADGRVVHRLKLPGGIVTLAFSPDGRYLAVAGTVVRVWDVRARRFLKAQWQHPQDVYALVFNRRGSRLVTACADQTARVFAVPGDPGRPAPLFAPLPHQSRRQAPPAFVDDERGLVTISGDRQLTWWDAESGKPARWGAFPTKGWMLTRVVANPQGTWLAAGGWGAGEVWNLADPSPRPVLLDHTNRVEDFAFSRDGATLLTVSWDQTARLWSLPKVQAAGPPLAHMGTVLRGSFSPDGAYLATAQEDGLVRIWKRPPGDPIRPLAARGAWRYRVSADGRLAAPGLWHEQPAPYGPIGPERLAVLDVATGQPAGPVIPLPGELVDSCVCADNRSAAAVSLAGGAGWLSVADVPAGRAAFAPRKLPGRPLSVAARPHAPQVAVLCKGGKLLVFDTRTGKQVFGVRHDPWSETAERWARVEYAPDGATLVTLTDNWDNVLHVRDADTGRPRCPPLRLARTHVLCRSFAISPDSRLLATAVTGDNAVQVWDLASGRALGPSLPHPGDAYGLWHVSFSPDGRHVLTSHRDGQARLWDWEAGRLACPPLKHPDQVFAGWITADGRHAVTACAGDRGTLHVWELTTGKLVAPPLPLTSTPVDEHAPAFVSLSPGGKRALALFAKTGALAQIRLAEFLARPDLATEDFRLLAELASAQRIELGAVSALTADQWLERYHRFRERLPDFDRPPSDEAVTPPR